MAGKFSINVIFCRGSKKFIIFRSFRYIDDIFMTSNDDIVDITKQLNVAKGRDVNININYDIRASVDFLDVTIINEEGRLRTAVYHKSAAEPYILPFTSDHPRHIHRNIPHAALLRAARLCSHVEDFDKECVRLDVSLLLNDYPSSFITSHIDRFFRLHHAMSVKTKLDQRDYSDVHHKYLHTATRQELAMAPRIQDPITAPTALEEKKWDRTIVYPTYAFDRAYTINLPDRFHRWWHHFYRYPGCPVRSVAVYLTATTQRTLDQELIHKKPDRHLLTLDASR